VKTAIAPINPDEILLRTVKKSLHRLLDNEVATFSDDDDYSIDFSELAFADELIEIVAKHTVKLIQQKGD